MWFLAGIDLYSKYSDEQADCEFAILYNIKAYCNLTPFAILIGFAIFFKSIKNLQKIIRSKISEWIFLVCLN